MERSDLEIETRQLVLEKLRVQASAQVASYAMREAELRTWLEPTLDRLVIQLQSYVLTQKLIEEPHRVEGFYRQRSPATWRDAFKIEHPKLYRIWRWPLKPIPAQMEGDEGAVTVTFERHKTLPNADIRLPPSLGQYVITELATEERHHETT